MSTLSSFFIILLVAVVFSQLFSRMKVPWVVALIAGGIIIGPSGFGIFKTDPTIDFLATIGLVLLMFMAGVESRASGIGGIKKRIIFTGLFIGFFPALVGGLIILSFGYSWPAAILMSIIFMSSAIAALIPQLQANKIIGSDLGKTIIGATVAIDALSLIFLSIFLQALTADFSPLNLMSYILIIVLVVLAAIVIPRIRKFFFSEEYAEKQDLFEKELRFVMLVLIGFVVLFELVGLHAIIAAFFAGLILSKSMESRLLKAKLHTMGYGFLIPVFFVVIGATTDFSVFSEGFATLLVLSIIIGLVGSKFIGGWIAGRLGNFNNRESALLGAASIPQLSTSLAVAFLGFGEGLLDQEILAAIVVLTIATVTIAPIIVNKLSHDLASQQVTVQEKSPSEKS